MPLPSDPTANPNAETPRPQAAPVETQNNESASGVLRLPPLPPVSAQPLVPGSRADPWSLRTQDTIALLANAERTGIQHFEVQILEPTEDESFDVELEQLVDLYELLIDGLHAAGATVDASLVASADREYVAFIGRLAARMGLGIENWLVPPSEASDELFQLIAAHSPGASRGVDLS